MCLMRFLQVVWQSETHRELAKMVARPVIPKHVLLLPIEKSSV